MTELKLLDRESIPSALSKAERYRLLNQPWEAESIYLDILEIEPAHAEALVGLLLAITDQFADAPSDGVARARTLLPRLQSEYEAAYYAGIICERRAKVVLSQARPGFGGMPHELLLEAQDWYQRAEALSSAGNDDAKLRWNACERLVKRYPRVLSVAEDRFEPYAD